MEKMDKTAHQSCQRRMGNEEDEQAPSTHNSMHSLSSNYSQYMANLKGGASSGITDIFGTVTLAEASSRLSALSQKLKAMSEDGSTPNGKQKPSKEKKQFSVEDKVGAVYAILSGALNASAVAETYGADRACVTRWVEVACRAIEDSLRKDDISGNANDALTANELEKTDAHTTAETREINATPDNLKTSNAKEIPVHFAIMSIAAEYQKFYVKSLKEGNRSGISDKFGKAESLLVPPIPEPTPISKDKKLEPKDNQDFSNKAQHLQDLMRTHCEHFLAGFLRKSREGKYGSKLQTVLNKESLDTKESEKICLKELVCASLFVSVLDQGDIEHVPEWVQAFLGRAFFKSNQIIETPSVNDIMQTYSTMEDYEVCRLIAERCLNRLGLRELSDAAVLPIYEFLYRSGPKRRELIEKALA